MVPEKFWGHDLVDSIAAVRTVDVFMGMHGAGFVNSFYMQPVRAGHPAAPLPPGVSLPQREKACWVAWPVLLFETRLPSCAPDKCNH